jgi:RimJ/RimL family protein N-acetyltransferase
MAEIPLPSPPLSGNGFALRPFQPEDYEAASAGREDPESARWVNALPFGDAESMAAAGEAERRAGHILHLCAIGEDGRFLGEVVLCRRTVEMAEVDVAEIAYVVAPEARGRGIASQAVRLVTEWAFAELGVKRAEVSVHPDNAASRRVAEKAGFQFEGVLRSLKLIRGVRVDACRYSRLPADPG